MKAKIILPDSELMPRLEAYLTRKIYRMGNTLKLLGKFEKLNDKTLIFDMTSPIGTSHLMFRTMKGELQKCDKRIIIEKLKDDD